MANRDPWPARRAAPAWGTPTAPGGPVSDPARPGVQRPGVQRPGALRPGVPRPDAPAPGGFRTRGSRSGGADGNERLTALTGTVLLVLLAAEGFTILGLRQMITLHFFIGMLLLGPVTLKLCSTGYRFFRYYTGSAPYRRKGPPAPLLRLLGPVIVAATVGVFGSGVGLALAGPGNSALLLFLHKGSFVVWFGAMSVHVLYYLRRLPDLIRGDLSAVHRGQHSTGHRRAVQFLGGRGVRVTLLAASLLAGLVIAMLTVHLSGPWHFVRFH